MSLDLQPPRSSRRTKRSHQGALARHVGTSGNGTASRLQLHVGENSIPRVHPRLGIMRMYESVWGMRFSKTVQPHSKARQLDWWLWVLESLQYESQLHFSQFDQHYSNSPRTLPNRDHSPTFLGLPTRCSARLQYGARLASSRSPPICGKLQPLPGYQGTPLWVTAIWIPNIPGSLIPSENIITCRDIW